MNEVQARQSDIEFEKKVCPNCNGGGVYQEYDEYDRYTVHSCATCDGSGEIARQSAIAALQAYQPWVNVEDRLPPGNVSSVLIFTEDGGVAEGQYYPSIDSWKQFRWSVENSKVTHWMPLPEPPKEERVMKSEQAINIAKGCVMASYMESETKQAVIKALNQVYEFSVDVMFCPNCGQAIDWSEE